MPEQVDLTFHNYIQHTPGLVPSLRGGDPTLDYAKSDLDATQDFIVRSAALIQGKYNAEEVVLRQRHAYGARAESLRDLAVHAIGGAAGFDLDGALTESEREMKLVLSDEDRRIIGMDRFSHDRGPLECLVRQVVFASLIGKRDTIFTEVEIDHPAVAARQTDIEMTARYGMLSMPLRKATHSRLLSVRPLDTVAQ